jgi:hypothetical protein
MQSFAFCRRYHKWSYLRTSSIWETTPPSRLPRMPICARKFGISLTSKLVLFFGAALVTTFMLNPVARAQETGQITGVVSDATGAALQAIVVTATNTGTNASRTATTNSTGTYSFIGLPPAVYQISTPGTGGFQGYKAKAEVTVGGKLTFDFKLSLGSTTTEVEVSAEGVPK